MKMIGMAAALAATLALPLPVLAGNVQLSFVPPADRILAYGQSTFVDVVASYDGTDVLIGGAIGVTFDASLLQVLSVVLRAPSDVAGTVGTVSTVGNVGMISPIGFASFVGVAGTFNFATIEFNAMNTPGVSALTAYDANDLIYNWASASPVTVLSTAGSITVVPEPATWITLAGGLAGLLIALRRRT